MDRFALSAILLLAVGLWLHPFFSGQGQPGPHASAIARQISMPEVPLGPSAAPKPIEPDISAIKTFKGNEGFWRLGQSTDGVWWFISPKNQPEFLNTVTTVQPYQFGRDKDGIHYISRDWQGKTVEPCSTNSEDPNVDAWAKRTAQRVLDYGFKGIGAWSNHAFHNVDIPMTRDLNLTSWVPSGRRKLYYPEWSAGAEAAVVAQVVALKDNHNLVGYFLDNELDWDDSGSGPAIYFDDLPASDPNRQQVVIVMQSIWKTLDEFNADWHSDLKSWSDLDHWTELPHEHSQAYSRLFTAWLSHMSADYFRITCSLVRKYDPNHLILGVRFRGYAPKEVVRSSRDWTNVQSLNYYVADARLDSDMFKMMTDESGQPVMITEYSFHSLDGRSGDRNTVGFAAQVLDQRARADGYRLFTTRAARVPFVIGVDWFQWSDEPPSGRSSDGEDVNFGVVDVDDNAYQPLVDAVRSTEPLLNPAHASSEKDPQGDVWRESFAVRPVFSAPYLTHSIRLNGELSDWPAECKLQGMRHSQTVGLERSKLPLPNVYLGWTDEGVYLGMEVFDDDINGAPANGWWWTRDFVEFWINTRAAGADQNAYDLYSNQFFFVPNAWPGEDGRLGSVGRWHRPGDSLKDNIIADPEIRSAVRVLPDRYVVEMLIPAKSLYGFDPRHDPNMAFNIHMRNFQHATDYFWSAPKEVMTQVRPSTWGEIHLDQPGGNLVQSGDKAPAATLR